MRFLTITSTLCIRCHYRTGPLRPAAGHYKHFFKRPDFAARKITPFKFMRFLYSLRAERHFSIIFTFFGGAPGTCDSTLNPILYNVMSHRYRVAFKETLCGKRKTYSNGLGRDQSSFRETTVASTAGYENSHLVSTIFHTFDVWCNEIWCLMELNHQVRIRSVRASHYKERNSMNTNTMWKNNNSSTASVKKVS